jgi:hypothetical protein
MWNLDPIRTEAAHSAHTSRAFIVSGGSLALICSRDGGEHMGRLYSSHDPSLRAGRSFSVTGEADSPSCGQLSGNYAHPGQFSLPGGGLCGWVGVCVWGRGTNQEDRLVYVGQRHLRRRRTARLRPPGGPGPTPLDREISARKLRRLPIPRRSGAAAVVPQYECLITSYLSPTQNILPFIQSVLKLVLCAGAAWDCMMRGLRSPSGDARSFVYRLTAGIHPSCCHCLCEPGSA